MNLRYLKLSLMCLLLIDCGGGGGGSASSTAPSIGYFVDAPVNGVTYNCGALSGTTGTNGSFSYDAGTSCTFSLGNVTIGSLSSVPSDGNVTPFDVAGVSRSNATAPGAIAVAQFLQSLDSGSNSGVITIPQSVTAALSAVPATTIVTSSGIPASTATLQSLVTAASPTASLVSSAIAAATMNAYIQTANININITIISPSGSSYGSNSSNLIEPTLTTSPGSTLTPNGTSVGFSATSNIAANGFWELLPSSSTAPNVFQLMQGLDGKNNSITLSGSSSMSAATTTNFSVTGLAYSTSYKLYFVATNTVATSLTSSVITSSVVTGSMPTAPNLTISSSTINSTTGSASPSVTSDINAVGAWVISTLNTQPTASQVIAGNDSSGNAAIASGNNLSLPGGSATSINVTGMNYGTNYYFYFVAVNYVNNSLISNVVSEPISVGYPSPPSITSISSNITPAGSTAIFNVTLSTNSTAYWVALPSSATPPSVAQVVAGMDSNGNKYVTNGNQSVNARTATNITLYNLNFNTVYTIYFVASSYNNSASTTPLQTVNVARTISPSVTTLTRGYSYVGQNWTSNCPGCNGTISYGKLLNSDANSAQIDSTTSNIYYSSTSNNSSSLNSLNLSSISSFNSFTNTTLLSVASVNNEPSFFKYVQTGDIFDLLSSESFKSSISNPTSKTYLNFSPNLLSPPYNYYTFPYFVDKSANYLYYMSGAGNWKQLNIPNSISTGTSSPVTLSSFPTVSSVNLSSPSSWAPIYFDGNNTFYDLSANSYNATTNVKNTSGLTSKSTSFLSTSNGAVCTDIIASDGVVGTGTISNPNFNGVYYNNAIYFIDVNAIRRLDLISKNITTIVGSLHSCGDAQNWWSASAVNNQIPYPTDGAMGTGTFIYPQILMISNDGSKLYVLEQFEIGQASSGPTQSGGIISRNWTYDSLRVINLQ